MTTVFPDVLIDTFRALGGYQLAGLPVIDSTPQKTADGTPYLTAAGVAVVGRTQATRRPLRGFLRGFDDPDFVAYAQDDHDMDAGARLAKTAGQLCYLSFGPKRTPDSMAVSYFHNIRAQGHGSILEHASISVFLYGIDRAVTHELVRHRSGMAYSQVSQRYVDGSSLRFVERPEYQDDPALHRLFTAQIDQARRNYDARAARLLQLQEEAGADLPRTARRKSVNQAARAGLPNEAEAPILVTGNLRAWRHVLEMRCSPHADRTIREAMFRVGLCLALCEPVIFGDYTFDPATCTIDTPTRKV